MQILSHMVEIIPYWQCLWHDLCYKIIAAAGEPPHFGRSLDAPERLAAVQRPETEGPDELLGLLNDEVRAAARAIRQG